MRNLAILAASSLALASQSLVPAAALANSSESTDASAKPKKICRTVEGRTGSRLASGNKVCRTAEDWEKLEGRGGAGAGLTVEKGKPEKDVQGR